MMICKGALTVPDVAEGYSSADELRKSANDTEYEGDEACLKAAYVPVKVRIMLPDCEDSPCPL